LRNRQSQGSLGASEAARGKNWQFSFSPMRTKGATPNLVFL
jgi:hypothetical protein